MSESKAFYDTVANRHRLFYRDQVGLRQAGSLIGWTPLPAEGARSVLDCTWWHRHTGAGPGAVGYEVSASDLSDETWRWPNVARTSTASPSPGIAATCAHWIRCHWPARSTPCCRW